MRYDPADRVHSFSFSRDPGEHADAMLEAGRRLTVPAERISPWRPFFLMIGIGVAIGVAMEFYRDYVLPGLLGTVEVAPLSVILLEMLPVVVIGAALISVYAARARARARSAIIARLDPQVVIDVDIFRQGIRIAAGPMTMEIGWTCFRDVTGVDGRIDLEADAYVIYIPERAFHGRAAFNEAAAEIRKLWREALKHEHDSRMVAAGLD